MPVLEESIEIAAPVEKVFGLVTDPDRWPSYVKGLVSVSDFSDEIRPGTSFRWEYRISDTIMDGEGQVNQFVPNVRFSMTMTGGISLKESYTFVPRNGGTELQVRVEFDIPNEVGGEIRSTAGEEKEGLGKETLETIRFLCEENPAGRPVLH